MLVKIIILKPRSQHLFRCLASERECVCVSWDHGLLAMVCSSVPYTVIYHHIGSYSSVTKTIKTTNDLTWKFVQTAFIIKDLLNINFELSTKQSLQHTAFLKNSVSLFLISMCLHLSLTDLNTANAAVMIITKMTNTRIREESRFVF